MAVFVRKLKKAERSELSRLLHSREDGRVVRRAQMILQSSQGIKVPAIASAWDTTIQTVLKTIHRFNAEGLVSLTDKPCSGCLTKTPRLIYRGSQTRRSEITLRFRLALQSRTLERLRQHVGHQTDVLLNPRYLSSLMGKHGIVYHRPKHLTGRVRY
jgi:transposase